VCISVICEIDLILERLTDCTNVTDLIKPNRLFQVVVSRSKGVLRARLTT